MVRGIRKKMLFFVGIFLTGMFGTVNSFMRTNYSKNNSLITPKARADTPSSCGWCGCPWTDAQCTIYHACFPAGTLISTPSGQKEIQKMVVGDRVYGFDTKTGKQGEYPITRTLKHGRNDTDTAYSPLINITYAGGVLGVTDNHWIYRRNGRDGDYANFDRAGMLQVGDMLTTENGEELAITKIDGGPEYDFVYNLEVAEVHTYFASGIRVHNSGGGGCCGSSK